MVWNNGYGLYNYIIVQVYQKLFYYVFVVEGIKYFKFLFC